MTWKMRYKNEKEIKYYDLKKKNCPYSFSHLKKKGFVKVHLLKFNIRSLKILMGDLLKEVVFTFFFSFFSIFSSNIG